MQLPAQAMMILMNKLEKIKLIENKIQEIKTALTFWNQEIEKYTLTLTELTNQLDEIKRNIK